MAYIYVLKEKGPSPGADPGGITGAADPAYIGDPGVTPILQICMIEIKYYLDRDKILFASTIKKCAKGFPACLKYAKTT